MKVLPQRTRFLHYCKGCGRQFYTNDKDQAYCQEDCKKLKFCPTCHKGKERVLFMDRQGHEYDECRDCHYNKAAPPKARKCPDCGEDPGDMYRCPTCTEIHKRTYLNQGEEIMRSAHLAEAANTPTF